MTETLKRTFHGCLTCRKRKVRCLGGNPCQNCSRMNITCHSSFETNLRIRVSTPSGQRVVDTKPEPIRGLRRVPPQRQQQYRQHQPPPPLTTTAASSSPPVDDASDDIFIANFDQQRFAQYSLPPPSPGFIATSFPDVHAFSTAVSQGMTVAHCPDFDHHYSTHFTSPTTTAASAATAATAWPDTGFDQFSYLDSALNHRITYHERINLHQQSSTATMTAPPSLPSQHQQPHMAFNVWMPETASSPNVVATSFISEPADRPVHRHVQQDGPKEWVPKRRRRNKKGGATPPSSSKQTRRNEAVSTRLSSEGGEDVVIGLDRFHNYHHNAQE
ncbi:hypothetical protein QBC42DRAFT_273294 [Cladorrhinum samala]|uniref:Zn(2)-C6 fungal-type domain-containing protein n=1 Tax=Cladorrhinum samala TaxID=585594 RepID=A0AAV9HGX9_9PEZI|nr:hypothetical protein QBC42DRAFT_273294 [Cladorrhinum samala]